MEKKDRIPNEAWESRWPNEEPVTKHLGKNYRLEGEPRAVFWGEYREMLKKVEEKLHPGQVITPRDDLSIGLMGNSNLLTEHFDLRSPDRNPISGIDLKTGKKWTIPYAGKSGFIDFSHIVDPKTGEIVKPPTQDDLQMLVDANFGRDKRPTDHAYFATVQELNHSDYTPYWAPLPNHPLHVRFVHSSQITENPPRDLRIKAKESLLQVWKKAI